jgi:hypothetical protein
MKEYTKEQLAKKYLRWHPIILKKFLKNLGRCRNWPAGERDFIFNGFVCGAFIWSETPEGHDYWFKVYLKYHKEKEDK